METRPERNGGAFLIDRAAEMDGPYVAVVGQTGGSEGRVGATNIGRLRQGKAARGGANVTSWHLRVFAVVVGVMGCLLLAASLVMSALHQVQFRNGAISVNFRGLQVCICCRLRSNSEKKNACSIMITCISLMPLGFLFYRV